MGKCVFIKDRNKLVSLPVSEEVYDRIRNSVKFRREEATMIFPEGDQAEDVSWLSDQKRVSDSFFVKDRDYFRRVYYHQIRWVRASGSYCCLYLDGTSRLTLSFNLRELTLHLSSDIFLRVHRSYIVNINYVDSFIGNMLCIGKERIPVSKQHKPGLMARLNVLGNVK